MEQSDTPEQDSLDIKPIYLSEEELEEITIELRTE